MRVYIVVGHTGEYEDRYEWNAFAFTSLEKAESKMKEGNDLLAELLGKCERTSYRSYMSDEIDKALEYMQNNFDKRCSVDYTGSYYTVDKLDVEVENE